MNAAVSGAGEGDILFTADCDMSRFTSFRAGGKADLMAEVSTPGALSAVLRAADDAGAPVTVMGNGTNILVRDGGYRGVIIRLGQAFANVSRDGDILIAGGALPLSALAKYAAAEGLSGLEPVSGVPGSVGGAVFMNAGAYGGEIKDTLKAATLMMRDGSETYEAPAESLDLSYRHSALQASGDIVLSAAFELKKGDPAEIGAQMRELTAKRNAKQPVNLPSAGSFFKRPEGYFAGALIESAGLKGLAYGDAQVSPLHAGFIVNNGHATATDIQELMRVVQNTVYHRFGVRLEPEVRIIGEDAEE